MRGGVLALAALALAFAALPAGPARAQPECTACQCGAAYCEGGHEYWGVVRIDPLPERVNVSEPFQVTWRLALVSNDPNAPPPSGTWSHGQTGLVLSPDPIDNATQPGSSNATAFQAAVRNATYPGTYVANVTFHEPEVFHVRAWGTAWSQERVVSTEEPVSVPTTVQTTTGHKSPAPGVALLAGLAVAAVWSRRRR